MRIISIENEPVGSIRFADAGRRGPELRWLPVLAGRADGLPGGVDGLVLAADLQGREECGRVVADARLLGEILPDRLGELLVERDLPLPHEMGAVLAGDLYTVPLLTKRGGTGDVMPVWSAWAAAFEWVTGVAGNHDLFGSQAEPPRGWMHHPRLHVLDGAVRQIGGVSFGGVPGSIGNSRRPNRFEEDDYVDRVRGVLDRSPDVLVLHDGPDAGPAAPGSAAVRSALERGAPRLVVRGHCHWESPLATLANGTQVLNVDGRVVVLTAA